MRRRALSALSLMLLVVGFVLGSPQTALAQVPFDVGVSVKGGVNFSGLTKEGEQEYRDQAIDIPYPGFFGVGGGVGLFIEPRVLDLLGIEIGFIYEMSKGEGNIEIGGRDYTLHLESTDLVIPIHARIATPGMVKFVFGVGVDLVVPLDQTADQEAGLGGNFTAIERDETTCLGFTLGLEIDAPYVTIPIEIRGRWAAGLEDTYNSRIGDLQGNPISLYEMKPNWELQGMILVGVGYSIGVL